MCPNIFYFSWTTLEEQLAGAEQSTTQWQKTCKKLQIEWITAYNPQANSRIERLWQTLQGRLPYIFRYLKINTIEIANKFLIGFIDSFNAYFSVSAQDEALHWKGKSNDTDFQFSVCTEKKQKLMGSFIYHSYKFRLPSKHSACGNFTLCLDESYGFKGFMNGKYYDIELCEPLCDVVGEFYASSRKRFDISLSTS